MRFATLLRYQQRLLRHQPPPLQTIRWMSGITHTMETESYNQNSIHQYDAHRGCQHLLEGVLERLAKRIALDPEDSTRPRHIVDLGAADGANSMRTLQWAIHTLKNQLQQSSLPPLNVTLEEHPESDQEFLQKTIDSHKDWFLSNGIRPAVLMKSFYEPVFQPSSVDLLTCYICLHWLDSSDTHSSVSEWKSWTGDDDETLQKFVFMNENTAPWEAKERWRNELARRHLAKFLALRAHELKPGAEGVLMMVGAPQGFVCPSENPSQASPLTLAMQTCVQEGSLREQVLKDTLVPYYIRTTEDIRDALELAATIPIPASLSHKESVEYPGALLSLVDILAYPVSVGKQSVGDTSDNFQGGFDMLWSIHQGAIRGAGATEAELEAIRLEARRWCDELYDPEQGIEITYLACVIRRRTRKAWSS